MNTGKPQSKKPPGSCRLRRQLPGSDTAGYDRRISYGYNDEQLDECKRGFCAGFVHGSSFEAVETKFTGFLILELYPLDRFLKPKSTSS